MNIAKRLSIHMYDPEHKIIKQNDKAGHMYFISSGECTVIVKDQNFKKQYVRILKEGDYFGEVALMTRAKRTATVTANNYWNIASITKEVFEQMITQFRLITKGFK